MPKASADLTFTEFMEKLAEYKQRNPGQRRGQALFNALCIFRPDLSEQIRTTDKDPFYRDERVRETTRWIQEMW